LKNKKKNQIKVYQDKKKDIIELLIQPTVKIAEFLTGILVSETKDLKLSGCRIIQAVIKNNNLTQLGREIEEYTKKGQIKEDYLESSLNQATITELLNFIDEEVIDEVRFKAMKSIFFSSVENNSDDQKESLAYELLQICKELTSGDILILKATFEILKNPGDIDVKDNAANKWINNISKKIGHNLPSLITYHENHLMDLNLISPRIHNDRSGIVTGKYYRLSDLGYTLCEFITKYD